MEKIFSQSTLKDLDAIFSLYDAATAFQKTVFEKQWEGFERSLVETEIGEGRQWKLEIDGEIACVLAVNYSDVLFWQERDSEPAIYLHRIATNPKFRGQSLMLDIVNWGKNYCKTHKMDYIRLDTWGDNPRLIDYYVRSGFTLLKVIDLDNTAGLPKHYKGKLALLEMKVLNVHT